MGIFIGILEEGLIYALLALGVLITYRILDFPDLTVDSSFPLGAAVSAILTVNGMHPVLTLLMATLAGAAVIIGTNIFKNRQKVNSSTAAIAGSLIYKACVALALSLGLVPQDLKLVTAALFLIILVLGGIRRKKVKFDA